MEDDLFFDALCATLTAWGLHRRLTVDERTAFSEMFTRMLHVAPANQAVIRRFVDDACNTSSAKVLDNAIVGFLITREGV